MWLFKKRHKLAEQSSHRQVAIIWTVIRSRFFKRLHRWIIQTTRSLLLHNAIKPATCLYKKKMKVKGNGLKIGTWSWIDWALSCAGLVTVLFVCSWILNSWYFTIRYWKWISHAVSVLCSVKRRKPMLLTPIIFFSVSNLMSSLCQAL